MSIQLDYATAGQEIPLGHFVDETDGKTAETGLTIANTDIKLWKAKATSLVNKNSGGATHMAGGVYYCTLDATDTNTEGPLVIFCQVAGALPVRVECHVRERWYWTQSNYWRHVVFFQATGTPTASVIRIGTVSFSDVSAWTDNDAYVGMQLVSLFNRTNVSRVVDYNGATKDLTLEPPLTFTPSSGDYFMLLPGAPGVLADGAITAGKVATDAFTAAKFAADVTTELQAGLATAASITTLTGYVDTEVASILAAIDTEVAAILAAVDTEIAQIVALLDNEIALIKAKTDNLPASPAAVGSAMTLADSAITEAKITADGLNAIADALLKRDFSAVSGEAARSALNALRFLRNKWSVAGSTLTVTKENDSTTAWTAAVTDAAGADPITGVDPA